MLPLNEVSREVKVRDRKLSGGPQGLVGKWGGGGDHCLMGMEFLFWYMKKF